jgi:peptide/nickel transport system substrate-binding protein
MYVKFSRKLASLVLATVLLALVACGGDDEETATSQPAAQPAAQTAAATPQPASAETPSDAMDGPKFGGVIKAVNESGVGSLDNMFTSAFATRNVTIHMFENVTTLDADYAVRPMVADWAISGDGSVYTFTIRDGLTFHDGSAVTAADVGASIDRYNRASSAKAFFGIIMANVDQIEEVDDSTLRITFKRPVPTLLNGLAASSGRVPHVMPKRLAETDHKESVTEFIGTGPYMLKEWVQGDRVELERYDGYVAREEPSSFLAGKRHAYADEIHIFEVPDQTTRVAGLESGQFDYLFDVSPDFFDTLDDNSDIETYIIDPGIRPFAWFNNENPPTDTIAMRRAMVTSWDHDKALLASGGRTEFYKLCPLLSWCVDGFEGEWQINQSDVTGGSDLYNINDKDMARQLAEDAGYAGEPIVVLASQDVPAMFNTVSVLVENMRDAGFNVDFRPMDDASVKQQRAAQSGWNMLVTTGGWANAANTRFRTAPVSAFVSRYAPSARLTELSELIHFETDQAKHLQWLNEIQTLYYQESGAGYHIGQLKALTAARSWLKGYEAYPILFLANTWLDR